MSDSTDKRINIVVPHEHGVLREHSKFDERNYIAPPEVTHSPAELDRLHAAIRFTKTFKQDEANTRADAEVEQIERVLPFDPEAMKRYMKKNRI